MRWWNPKLSFAQMDGKCYCFRKGEHKFPNVFNRTDLRKKVPLTSKTWGCKFGSTTTSSVSKATVSTQVIMVTWVWKNQSTRFDGWDILQSRWNEKTDLVGQSFTSTIFCNPDVVRNIKNTDELLDLHTNGGMIRSTKKFKQPSFGQAWFNHRLITKVFSI